jgi:hypothetical protein
MKYRKQQLCPQLQEPCKIGARGIIHAEDSNKGEIKTSDKQGIQQQPGNSNRANQK